MIDNSTREVIGELLKNQSADKDKVLYDLLIDGSIRFEDDTTPIIIRPTETKPQQSKNTTSEEIKKEKPEWQEEKLCYRTDCKFNEKGECKSRSINVFGERCNESNGFMRFEPKEATNGNNNT